jgi:nicotinate dehydrogenase subunit A
MTKMIELYTEVNGERRRIEAHPATPLLYVLRNDMGLTAPKFGCGVAQCGACTVHLDGRAIRSCLTPATSAVGAKVRTLEGLAGADGTLHIVQQAFIDEQAAQCGYCLSGWVMTAVAMLEANPNPTDEEIRKGLAGLKCRCGTHMSILRAVKRAAARMAGQGKA